MHVCRGIPQLEASGTSGEVARMHAGVPFRSACVKYFKVSTNKPSACLRHACTSHLLAKKHDITMRHQSSALYHHAGKNWS